LSEEAFTYEKPDETLYLKTLIKWAENKGERELAGLLRKSKCRIMASGSFSRNRWNAYWTTVHFYVPVDLIPLATDDVRNKLLKMCDEIMPPEVGYDVMHVDFAPSMLVGDDEVTLSDDLDGMVNSVSGNIVKQILPDDIRNKGKDMAEAYLYLYCVENALRLFIEKVAKDKYGDNYFKKLNLTSGIKTKITTRKEEESKNKWLSIRGSAEIFYLDFRDLGALINNNWDLFKSYFPDVNWIIGKVNELADCRNLVAHNSFIGSHEKDMIRLYFHSILRQIGIIT